MTNDLKQRKALPFEKEEQAMWHFLLNKWLKQLISNQNCLWAIFCDLTNLCSTNKAFDTSRITVIKTESQYDFSICVNRKSIQYKMFFGCGDTIQCWPLSLIPRIWIFFQCQFWLVFWRACLVVGGNLQLLLSGFDNSLTFSFTEGRKKEDNFKAAHQTAASVASLSGRDRESPGSVWFTNQRLPLAFVNTD